LYVKCTNLNPSNGLGSLGIANYVFFFTAACHPCIHVHVLLIKGREKWRKCTKW